MSTENLALFGHLFRRAGFGATKNELEAFASKGYDSTVDRLLDFSEPDGVQLDALRRYHPDHSGGIGNAGIQAYWLHRMIHSRKPLQEKVALFWHGVFATGYSKLTQGRVLMDQIDMFRSLGIGSLNTLLLELSRDPSMIVWLDNQDNHKGAINENFGRELLELFSMGVGNYSEDDIKECARAFTGWTVGNAEYLTLRAQNDSLWPYGRLNFHFEFDEHDHDNGDKTFLGETGEFNGENIVEIICRQPATARFISRHMYSFFVADEPPVTAWPHTPPRDPEAIAALSEAYFKSGHSIGEMLRVLFKSDFFKSEIVRYEKVKSPSELVAGVLRLTGELNEYSPKLQDDANQLGVMGQTLVNPPSVEGWHTGTEWLDTGNLVERINFATGKFTDITKPGIKEIADNISSDGDSVASPEQLLESCLEQMGAIKLSDPTKTALIENASNTANTTPVSNGEDSVDMNRIVQMLQLVASTPEFQRE